MSFSLICARPFNIFLGFYSGLVLLNFLDFQESFRIWLSERAWKGWERWKKKKEAISLQQDFSLRISLRNKYNWLSVGVSLKVSLLLLSEGSKIGKTKPEIQQHNAHYCVCFHLGQESVIKALDDGNGSHLKIPWAGHRPGGEGFPWKPSALSRVLLPVLQVRHWRTGALVIGLRSQSK